MPARIVPLCIEPPWSAVLIDVAVLAARYSDPDIWRRSLQEDDGEGPEA